MGASVPEVNRQMSIVRGRALLLFEVIVTIETELSTAINRHQEILTRDFGRKHNIVVDLFDQS